jgi:four helix bundle protein
LVIGQEQEMQDFRQLDVWKEAHELTLAVYKASASFPTSEIYGLTSQVKRAAYSIPSNIAEGCGRDTALDFARFLQIAQGSASELDYHLLLARDLGFLGTEDYLHLSTWLTRTRKMLTSLTYRVRPVTRRPTPKRVQSNNQ